MRDRIERLMKELELGTSGLAEQTNIKPSSISHVLSGRNKPGFEFIQKLLQAFPDLNARWFLTGVGEMYSASKNLKLPNKEVKSNEKDLFTNVKNEATPPSSSRDSNISSTPMQGDEKKQPEKENINDKITNSTHQTGNSEIERIVLFYRDGRFKEYHPRD